MKVFYKGDGVQSLILGFVGEKCAGTSEAVRGVRALYPGALLLSKSLLLQEIHDWIAEEYLSDRGVLLSKEATPEGLLKISLKLEEFYGPEVFAFAMRRYLEENPLPSIVLLDGVRNPSSFWTKKLLAPRCEFRLIYISSAQENRFHYHCEESEFRGKEPLSLEDFDTLCGCPEEESVQKLKVHADFVISNDTTLSDLHSRASNVVSYFQNQLQKKAVI